MSARRPLEFRRFVLNSRSGIRISFVIWHSAFVIAAPLSVPASTNLHTSWLWHLHQPVYWPDRRVSGPDHYEAAWDTIQQQNAGRPHPAPEILNDIFGLADRVAAYQGRPRDSLSTVLGYP